MQHSNLAVVLAAAMAVAACAVSHDPSAAIPQPVTGVPDRFVAADPSLPASPETGCLGRLVDSKSGVQLTLLRSGKRATVPETYWGDYEITPPGQFGIGSDKALRIACGTGRPLGTVPKKT